MPILTKYLRDEIKLIRLGTSQLEVVRNDLETGHDPDVASLRLLTYAMRALYKRNLLPKLESVLYPELTKSLTSAENEAIFDESRERTANSQARFRFMRLQLALDAWSGGVSSRAELAREIEDCLDLVTRTLQYVADVLLPIVERRLCPLTQSELFSRMVDLDRLQTHERAHATQVLLNRELQRAIG